MNLFCILSNFFCERVCVDITSADNINVTNTLDSILFLFVKDLFTTDSTDMNVAKNRAFNRCV